MSLSKLLTMQDCSFYERLSGATTSLQNAFETDA